MRLSKDNFDKSKRDTIIPLSFNLRPKQIFNALQLNYTLYYHYELQNDFTVTIKHF